MKMKQAGFFCTNIDGECDFCKRKAEFVLFFSGFFRRGARCICEYHRKEWFKNKLEV